MPEYHYAKGRIAASVQFISEEMREFEAEYSKISTKDYAGDKKLQKLMDRTVENILTALVEVCGTLLAEQGIAAESYAEAVKKCAAFFSFPEAEQEALSKLAMQRNRLAHRYLNFRWNAIELYKQQRPLVGKLVELILNREENKSS